MADSCYPSLIWQQTFWEYVLCHFLIMTRKTQMFHEINSYTNSVNRIEKVTTPSPCRDFKGKAVGMIFLFTLELFPFFPYNKVVKAGWHSVAC